MRALGANVDELERKMLDFLAVLIKLIENKMEALLTNKSGNIDALRLTRCNLADSNVGWSHSIPPD